MHFLSFLKKWNQSLRVTSDLRGANIGKLIIGENYEKVIGSEAEVINIKEGDITEIEGNNNKVSKENIIEAQDSNIQVGGNGAEQSITEEESKIDSNTLRLIDYFRVRKLIGWLVGAIAAGIVAYNIPVIKEWSGLIVIALIGWGTYRSLTADSKYLRYSRWVLLIGLGAAGILNGFPVIAGNLNAQLGLSDSNFVQFVGQFRMDEQPLITITILVLTFGLAGFLAYKDTGGE